MIGDHIDVRIDAAVSRVRIADFKKLGRMCGSIDQMMTVRIACLERSAIPGTENFLAGVGDESQFAFHYPNEFVLVTVPVTLAGPTAWRDHGQIDAEVRESVGSG